MRTARINARTLYYRQFISSSPEVDSNGLETGEMTKVYSDWIRLDCTFTDSSGAFELQPYGKESVGIRRIIFAKNHCPITEMTQIYSGSDTPTSSTKPNYSVSDIKESLTAILVVIKEVDVT